MKTAGFSLIEVLISLLLLALLLFGFAAAEVDVIRQARASYFFTIATNQLVNISERLRTPQTDETVTQWNQQNQNLLPRSAGQVTGEFPHFTVTIEWGNHANFCQQTRAGETGCIKEKIQVA